MDAQGTDRSTTHTLSPRRIAYGTEPLQFGDLYLPQGPGPHPVVILIHGGFWRAAYGLTLMKGLAKDLLQRGIAAWNIEYRRVGDPGGGWPGTLQDVARAADFVGTLANSYGLDQAKVVPVGHSAGGHLALWLAARPRLPENSLLRVSERPLSLRGAVSLAGASELKLVWQLQLGHGAAGELLRGSPEQVPERYATASPAELLPVGIPQVLIHGKKDQLVPLTVSQEYARKAKLAGDQVKLIELVDADHFVLIEPGAAEWGIVVREVQKLFVGNE